MPLNLNSTDTLTGSPVSLNGAPSGATPSNWFAVPTLSLGPTKLWAFAAGGNFAMGGVGLKLWYYEPDNALWAAFSDEIGLSAEKKIYFFPYEFAPTAKLYLEVTVNNPSATKVVFGFGIGATILEV